jgi:acyl carrier protein
MAMIHSVKPVACEHDEILRVTAEAIRSVSARARSVSITPDSRLLDDLALDSLDLVAVILKLQDYFEREIDPDLIPGLECVADLTRVFVEEERAAA